MQETRVLVETRGTTGEETISYWFDLPIDVAEFEEKLGIGAESGNYRIIEKVLPYADEVHEHTSVYQLNEFDFMYRQLSSDMQEEYVSLLTVFENLEALYICRSVITVYPKTFDGKKPYSFLKSQITYALRPKITYAGKAVKLHKQTLNETITAVRSVNYVPDKIY